MEEVSRATPDRTESLSDFVRLLWVRRWTVLVVLLICLAVALVRYAMAPRIYEATVTMLPQAQSMDTGLIGRIASFSGTPLGGSQSYEALYLQILRSDTILNGVMRRKWEVASSADSIKIYDILGVKWPSPGGRETEIAERKTRELLRSEVIFFQRDKLTGYMKLIVRLPSHPDVAADLANDLARQLDLYNRTVRTQKAAEQSRFVAGRLSVAEDSLRAAEGRRAAFVERNRNYQGSPALILRYGELDREVAAGQAVWVDLRRQLEAARIDENKQIVSVDVLDPARPNWEHIAPRLGRHVFAGGFFGVMLGVAAVMVHLPYKMKRAHIGRRS